MYVARYGTTWKAFVMGRPKKLYNLISGQTIKLAARHEMIHHAKTRWPHCVMFNLLLTSPEFSIELLAVNEIGNGITK